LLARINQFLRCKSAFRPNQNGNAGGRRTQVQQIGLAAGISDKFKIGICLCHPGAQCLNRAQGRWAIQAALLASTIDNVLPVSGAFFGGLSSDISIVRVQGLDLTNPEFSGHLHRGIHGLTFGDTQTQLDTDGRAPISGVKAAELDRHLSFADSDDRTLIFAAGSVKDYNPGVDANAQHILQVMAGGTVKFDAQSGAKVLLNKHSGLAHRLIGSSLEAEIAP